MDIPDPSGAKRLENNLMRLYWGMRLGIALIWIWTAIVSWFLYPQAESLDWLGRLGFTEQGHLLLAAGCLVDMAMGMAAGVFARRRIWQLQFAIVTCYSLVIAIGLPEFLIHPFGPISKNLAVLGCLAYLAMVEKR